MAQIDIPLLHNFGRQSPTVQPSAYRKYLLPCTGRQAARRQSTAQSSKERNDTWEG